MRSVRYAVAASLDGFVAGPKGEVDWIIMDPEIDFRAIYARYDTVLLGRHTFTGMTGGKKKGGGNFDFRNNYWTKGVYRLGIILVEYPDEKHNTTITPKAWDESMFSHDKVYNKSSTGQTAYGSMYDYYVEQSFGKLRVAGKVFAPVTASKRRAEYAAAANRFALFAEALDLLAARDGKDALKDYDGLFFLYAGRRVPTQRGGIDHAIDP